MQAIISYPQKKEEIQALKAFLKALKIKFEYNEVPYNPEFLAKIAESEEDYKAGRTRKVTLDEIWK